jgi:CTP synthase (UTP-ammonia lyase)
VALVNVSGHIVSGVLVLGGFGHRGMEGMLLAISYAREKKIYLSWVFALVSNLQSSSGLVTNLE